MSMWPGRRYEGPTSLSRQTKTLAVGAVLSGAVLVGVSVNTRRLDHRISQLQTACQEESEKERKKPELKGQFELLCDPTLLASSKGPNSPGVQGDLARAQRQRTRSRGWLGLLTIVVGSLPFAWYFLLPRIRN